MNEAMAIIKKWMNLKAEIRRFRKFDRLFFKYEKSKRKTEKLKREANVYYEYANEMRNERIERESNEKRY